LFNIIRYKLAGLLLLISIIGQCQNFYITESNYTGLSNTLQLNIDNCNSVSLPSCNATGAIFTDIAFDLDQKFWYITSDGQLFRQSSYDPTSCEHIGNFPLGPYGNINGLVADSVSNLYAAGTDSGGLGVLLKYTSGTFSRLGYFPSNIFPMADMFFYEGRMFMTAYISSLNKDALVEVSLPDPSTSTVYMTLNSDAYGAFSVKESTGTRAFILATDGTATSWLVEIDIAGHTTLDTLCTYPFVVNGAATFDGITPNDPTAPCDVFLPNAFTPNNDGRNDIYKPLFTGNHTLHTFMIMNRYGQEVFSTNADNTGWDGKFHGIEQNIGSYFYYLKCDCANGKTLEKKGDFTLIR